MNKIKAIWRILFPKIDKNSAAYQESASVRALRKHITTLEEVLESQDDIIKTYAKEIKARNDKNFEEKIIDGVLQVFTSGNTPIQTKVTPESSQRVLFETGQQYRFGDFEIKYVTGDGKEFDYGVDYIDCGNYKLVLAQGAGEFAPYVCMSDIALSDAMGWGLIRTETLADGCQRCDFRFKKGGKTRISSKTPAVQATIEKIAEEEATAD